MSKKELVTFREAAKLAFDYLNKDISTSNISYLVQYGLLERFYNKDKKPLVNIRDLKEYYGTLKTKQEQWEKRLGNDLMWNLSFDNLREKDTTKHVHRLHPYKGKFIPQLVGYFLDQHLEDFSNKELSDNKSILLKEAISNFNSIHFLAQIIKER